MPDGQAVQPKPPSTRRALVVCYSSVGRDARVSNQIRWLEQSGFRVDVLSRGPDHPDASGRTLTIGDPRVSRLRLGLLTLRHPRHRYDFLVGRQIPTAEVLREHYDLVVVNDHHVLPWAVEHAPALTDGPVILDLHELYADNGTSLRYRLLYAREDRWLLSFVRSPVFTQRLTVAEGIADTYRDDYAIPRPVVVRNVAPYEPDLSPSPVDPSRIALVHHGNAELDRGLTLMLDAAMLMEPRFDLELMVIGSDSAVGVLRRHPAVRSGRARLRAPVGVREVARALNPYDLEVIFFPPLYPNNAHVLPNKFFESIQGRLGVVIGDSPEMTPLVRRHCNGLIVEGWRAENLAAAVNQLTAEQVANMKRGSHLAARELSAATEGERFLAAISSSWRLSGET